MNVTKSSFLTFLSKLILLSYSIVMSFTIYAQEQNYDEYKVQAKDTLIQILKRHSLRPVFGENGSLLETLNLNPQKQKHNGDLIYIGEILKLPKSGKLAVKNDVIKEETTTEEYAKKDPTKNKIKPKINAKNEEEVTTKIQPKPQIIKPKQAAINSPHEEKPPSDKINEQKNKYIKENKIKPEIQQKDKIFIAEPVKKQPQKTESNNLFIENQNSSKIPLQDNLQTYPKTALPKNKVNNSEKTEKTNSQNDLNPVVSYKNDDDLNWRYEFFIDSQKYCYPIPACRIWFTELDSKCCKKTKTYFILTDFDSL